MRPAGTRILRRILIAVVVAVALAVGWTLRRPSPARTPGSAGGEPPPEGTTIGDLAFFQFDEGEEKVQVKARAMTGEEDGAMRLEGVEVAFPFVARDREGVATITSDECLYDAERQRANFRGNVHVVTDDGFELTSERLNYLGDEMRVSTAAPVQFGKGTTSGRAVGARYDMAAEVIELKAEVFIRFEDADRPPTEIESGRALADRRTRIIRFLRGVELRHEDRVLTSKRLRVTLDGDMEKIQHAAAIEDVDLRTGAGGEMGSAALPPGGKRRLRARRLNVTFRRDDGTLKTAVAVNGAHLELESAPGAPPETRRISGHLIEFAFDREERLEAVSAQAGGRRVNPENRPVRLSSETSAPGGEVEREIECRRFQAALDPETGALRDADFSGEVVFREPGRTARAQRALYDDGTALLRLREGTPNIHDEVDGSKLQAQKIDLATETRGITATGGVRHEIRRGGAAGEGGMLAGSEPAVLVARSFEYDSEARKAWYRDNALLRSGRDEIRAPLIVLEDPAPGQRRLHAQDGVVSFLQPRPGEEGAEDPAPVEARSREMVYEEAAGQVTYTGDVDIRQGDIVTLSPRAVVTLDPEGRDVERIVAGEPVTVHQGVRTASGQTGTYTPRTETMVLEGDDVVLQDVDRKIRGRVLTFQVGDDRIRVDGREEARTEAIFKKRESPRP